MISPERSEAHEAAKHSANKEERKHTKTSAIGKFFGPPLLGFKAISGTPISCSSIDSLYVDASYKKNAITAPVKVREAKPVNVNTFKQPRTNLLLSRSGGSGVAAVFSDMVRHCCFLSVARFARRGERVGVGRDSGEVEVEVRRVRIRGVAAVRREEPEREDRTRCRIIFAVAVF